MCGGGCKHPEACDANGAKMGQSTRAKRVNNHEDHDDDDDDAEAAVEAYGARLRRTDIRRTNSKLHLGTGSEGAVVVRKREKERERKVCRGSNGFYARACLASRTLKGARLSE